LWLLSSFFFKALKRAYVEKKQQEYRYLRDKLKRQRISSTIKQAQAIRRRKKETVKRLRKM